jgi:hypothetical protein
VLSTRWPGGVKPRNPTATTARMISVKIVFTMASYDTQQPLPVQSAVAKPSALRTRWPGAVKPRNPAATTATTTSALIVFTTLSRDRSACAGAVRRGEAKAAQYPMPWCGEAEKSDCDDRHDYKRDDLPHGVLP